MADDDASASRRSSTSPHTQSSRARTPSPGRSSTSTSPVNSPMLSPTSSATLSPSSEPATPVAASKNPANNPGRGGMWNTLWKYVSALKPGQQEAAPASNMSNSVDDTTYRLSRANLKTSRQEFPIIGGQWGSSAIQPTPDGPATFDPSTLARFQTSWLSGMQLSLWDNIFGPQVIKYWSGLEELEHEMQHNVARQILSGEIGRAEGRTSAPETTLHVLSEIDFVVSSTLFVAPYRGSNSKLALSLLVRQKHLVRFIELQHIVADRMSHLVAKFKKSLPREPDRALVLLNEQLMVFAHGLEPLFLSGLQPVAFSSTYLYSGSFSIEFIARAVTALLQTGAGVVCGPREDIVNTFVDTLAFFILPLERRRSSYGQVGRAYVPDLTLQGIIGRRPDEVLLQSMTPTAIIDLSSLSVRRLSPANEYAVLRREYRDWELEKLAKRRPNEPFPSPVQQYLQTVKAAPCVNSLIKELMLLPPPCREKYLQHCIQRLHRRAVALVCYVESQMVHEKEVKLLDAITKQQMRNDLDLNSDDDYMVVLNIAEKISPGLYTRVENPNIFLDHVYDFFHSFGGP